MTGARVEGTSLVGHWNVVASDSTASFTVRDKMVATVRGTMPIVDGHVDVGADGVARGRVTLDAAGIATGITKRDEHVRSAGFLDVEGHPHVVVEVGHASRDGEVYRGDGTLAARGNSAPLAVTGEIDRHDGDAVTVTVRARLDRAPLRMRVPVFIVGRCLQLEVTLRARRER